MDRLYLVFVYKVQLLRCCSKSKSSNTLVFCGIDVSHALNLNFLFQTREKRLVYGQALLSVFHKIPFAAISKLRF